MSGYIYEPLAGHERSSFECGVPSLDDYLRERASQDAKRRVAAPFVMLDADRTILGYYTLSAFAIRLRDLPESTAKKLPRYPLLPATLLGRLAVSRHHQGRRLGTLLLMDALHRSLRNTSQIASVGVVAESINDAAREFYLHHEFLPIPNDPRRVFVAMATIATAFRLPHLPQS